MTVDGAAPVVVCHVQLKEVVEHAVHGVEDRAVRVVLDAAVSIAQVVRDARKAGARNCLHSTMRAHD
eukprot:6172025-Pleurochrysis_carterae.AAC.5